MGYKYNYDDLRNMMLTSGYNTSDWSTNIQLIAQSFNDFVENDAFTGKWADNVKNYLSQVHVTSMTAVAQLISDFNSKMLVFVDGAYQYEMHESAKIPEERLVAGETLLDSMYTYYQEVHSEIKQLVDDVSGIVDVTMPSNESILSRITEIKTDLTAYKDDLYEYDQQWTRDLAELEEFITATKTIVTEICNNKGRNITAYQDGSFYELEAVQEMLAGYETSYDYVVNNQDRINLANQHQATVADIVNDRLAEERKEQGIMLVIGGLMALAMCAYVICASGGTMAPVAMTIVKGTLSSSAFAYGTSNIYQGIQEIEYGEAGDVTTVAVNPIRDTVFAGNQAAYDLWGELTMTACTFYVPLSKGFPASGSGATLSIKSPSVNVGKYNLKCAWKEFAQETAEEIVENKVTNGIDVALSTTDTKASTRMMVQIAGCSVTGKMGDVSPSAKTAADWCTPGINRVDFGVNNGKINTVIDCNPPAGGKYALGGKTTNVDISTPSKATSNVDVKMDVPTKAGDVEMNVPQKTKVEIDAKIDASTKASEVEINTPQKTEVEANANVAKATGTDNYNPKQNKATINIPPASKTKVDTKVEISTKSDNSKIDTPKDIEVRQDVKVESTTKAKEAEIKSPEISKAEVDVNIANTSANIEGIQNRENGLKTEDEVKRINEIKVEFSYKSKYDEIEFSRQLAAQQDGMNKLTIQEYLDNRQNYIQQGRALESNAAQQAAREKAFVDKVDELQDLGLTLKEAEAQATQWLNTQAALHNPDQVAGGHANSIGGVGDKCINSSIGIQWRYRIDKVDAEVQRIAESMSEDERNSTYLNVNLTYKGE